MVSDFSIHDNVSVMTQQLFVIESEVTILSTASFGFFRGIYRRFTDTGMLKFNRVFQGMYRPGFHINGARECVN